MMKTEERYNLFMESIDDFDEDVKEYLIFMYMRYFMDYPSGDIGEFWQDMFQDTIGAGVFFYLQNPDDYERVFKIVPDMIGFIDEMDVLNHLKDFPEDQYRRYCLEQFNQEVMNCIVSQY